MKGGGDGSIRFFKDDSLFELFKDELVGINRNLASEPMCHG